MADYLAVGIDPGRTTIFAHSQVPELNQLMIPFLSLVSVPELARNPTVKEERAAAGLPVGVRTAVHLSGPPGGGHPVLSRKRGAGRQGPTPAPRDDPVIARRFNQRYSPNEPFFPEPEALLSDAPRLLGTDGQKMSKSRNNAIAIGATEDETARLIRAAKTDSDRHITYDPVGRPEVSNLVLLAALCLEREPRDVAEEIGGGGAAALKRVLAEAVNERLRPVRSLRSTLIQDRTGLREVLMAGNETAKAMAAETLKTSGVSCTRSTEQSRAERPHGKWHFPPAMRHLSRRPPGRTYPPARAKQESMPARALLHSTQ